MAKLTSCQLESPPSVTELVSVQNNTINNLAVCNITIEASWRKFYIMSNLPNTEEWRTFASTFELTKKADTVARIITHLLFFEARLIRACGLVSDAALFVMKKCQGPYSIDEKDNARKGEERKGNDRWWHIIFHGCGVKGHIKVKCRIKYK
jgi:hypothetical protein